MKWNGWILTVLVPLLYGLVPSSVGQQLLDIVPCQDSPPPPKPGDPELPTLPDQFVTNVEANIVQKQMTFNMREYYDYPNNRLAITRYMRHTGETIRAILDFDSHERKLVFENNTCDIEPISSRGFFGLVSKNGSHIRSVKDMLYFGKEMGEVYVGEETVRGIPTDHWTACAKIAKLDTNFTLDYYFSKNDTYTIDGRKIRVPVRAVLNGTAQSTMHRNGTRTPDPHTFYHIYEFVDFHPGPIKDVSVFEVPVGTYCHRNATTKDLPKMPSQFTASAEVFTTNKNVTTHLVTQKIYLDIPSGVLRVDDSGPMTLLDVSNYGRMPLTFIYDRSNSLIYVIDQWHRNCTVSKAQTSWHFGQTPPFSWQKRSDQAPPIAGPVNELMYINSSDFVYQGKKTWRGMAAETWASYNKSTGQVIEVIMHRDTTWQIFNSIIPLDVFSGTLTLLGMYVHQPATSSMAAMTSYMHVFDYKLGHPDPNVFDVAMCYSLKHHYMYLGLKIQGGSSITNIEDYKQEFYAAVRAALAKAANVSVTRITYLLAEKDYQVDRQWIVYFKLLDNELSPDGVKVLTSGPSMSKAKLNLQSTISSGTFQFTVAHHSSAMNIKNKFVVLKDTLWVMMSSQYPTVQDTSSSIKQYSPASMAGLGIGMLIVGAILGLGAAYAIYRRIDTSVPYRITQ